MNPKNVIKALSNTLVTLRIPRFDVYDLKAGKLIRIAG
jgi:hypothetical protein